MTNKNLFVTFVAIACLATSAWAFVSSKSIFDALLAQQSVYNIQGSFQHDYENYVADPAYITALEAAIASAGSNGGNNALQSVHRNVILERLKTLSGGGDDDDDDDDNDHYGHHRRPVLPQLGTRWSWKNMFGQGNYVTDFVTQVVSPFFGPLGTQPLNWTHIPNVFWGADYGEHQLVYTDDGLVVNGAGTVCDRVAAGPTYGPVFTYASQEAGWNKATYTGQYFGKKNDRIALFTGQVDDIGSGQDGVAITIAARCYGTQTSITGAGLQCDVEFLTFAQNVCAGALSIEVTGVSRFKQTLPFPAAPIKPAICTGVSTGSYNAYRVPRCHSCTRAYTNPLNCNV